MGGQPRSPGVCTAAPPLFTLSQQKRALALVTESQNHRMVGVVRDLCGSSSPTLLPKQGHPQQAAQDLVQAGLEYLQRRRLHSLPGHPVPGLHHPQISARRRAELRPRPGTASAKWKGEPGRAVCFQCSLTLHSAAHSRSGVMQRCIMLGSKFISGLGGSQRCRLPLGTCQMLEAWYGIY